MTYREYHHVPTRTNGGYESADYRRDVPLDKALRAIVACCPSIEIQSIRPFGKGLGNSVFLINDHLIFRFSKHHKGDRSLRREITVLPALNAYLSIPIPHFRYFGTWSDEHLAFVGYKKIPGEALTNEILCGLPEEANSQVVKTLAEFFRELHAFPLDRASALGVEARELRLSYQAELADARQYVYPVIRQHYSVDMPLMIDKIEAAFARYLTNDNNFRFTPAVLHGDLEAGHILIDSSSSRAHIAGIIDFGGVHISDPAFDLWRPYSHFGFGFIQHLLRIYPLEREDLLVDKLEFFWIAQIVHRALRPILLNDRQSLKDRAFPALRAKLLG